MWFLRLMLNVVMQNDGDFLVVILLYLCEHMVWISFQCNLIVYVVVIIILLVYY